jgi:hypothetical protein
MDIPLYYYHSGHRSLFSVIAIPSDECISSLAGTNVNVISPRADVPFVTAPYDYSLVVVLGTRARLHRGRDCFVITVCPRPIPFSLHVLKFIYPHNGLGGTQPQLVLPTSLDTGHT